MYTLNLCNVIYQLYYYLLQLFLLISRLRFLAGVSISKSQKVIEWIDSKVEGYSRPEKHYEPILHN